MKIFEVISVKNNDEFQSYIGNDFDKAIKAYNDEVLKYSKLTEHDAKLTRIVTKIYTIDDTVNISNSNELNNALINCHGYDYFANKVE